VGLLWEMCFGGVGGCGFYAFYAYFSFDLFLGFSLIWKLFLSLCEWCILESGFCEILALLREIEVFLFLGLDDDLFSSLEGDPDA